MKDTLFSGVCTAMVTPFLDGKINYPMMEMLLSRQQQAGVSAVVIAGTTGESATLTDAEKTQLIKRSKDYVKDNMIVIAGTGSNCTDHAIYMSQQAQSAGADALLIVSPYYNKATDDGLVSHYMRIAHSISIPVIIYNVPSRTGMDISVASYQRLSRIGNIIGVKEASMDMEKLQAICALCPPGFAVYSGNDTIVVPSMVTGAKGVISAASNVIPEQMQKMCSLALSGEYAAAGAMQIQLFPLLKSLYRQVNPVGIKAAMKLAGFDCGGCRLPLGNASEETLAELSHFFPKKSAL